MNTPNSNTLDAYYVYHEQAKQRIAYAKFYRERHKQSLIVAIFMDELDLTPTRYLTHKGSCSLCGCDCPKKSTPVFKNIGEKQEIFFCTHCLDTLKQGAAEFTSAMQGYRCDEQNEIKPHLDMLVTGKLDCDIQKRLDEKFMASLIQQNG